MRNATLLLTCLMLFGCQTTTDRYPNLAPNVPYQQYHQTFERNYHRYHSDQSFSSNKDSAQLCSLSQKQIQQLIRFDNIRQAHQPYIADSKQGVINKDIANTASWRSQGKILASGDTCGKLQKGHITSQKYYADYDYNETATLSKRDYITKVSVQSYVTQSTNGKIIEQLTVLSSGSNEKKDHSPRVYRTYSNIFYAPGYSLKFERQLGKNHTISIFSQLLKENKIETKTYVNGQLSSISRSQNYHPHGLQQFFSSGELHSETCYQNGHIVKLQSCQP
ncbi:hypothetical protein L4C34_14095 [Vibrio profundum]|uniref:hypothetical protein n=1 Tax=Vibrio profundum TaxID=2910247 RepID=UPI003D0FB6F4